MRTKILTIVILLTLPLIAHAEIKEKIYSDQTTHPSFFCPEDSLRCELYKTIDGMNREMDPPSLIKVCWPSTFCSYINNIGASLGFRLLPGDICLSAANFKGYKVIEGVATTTTTTTTTIPTTTIIEYLDCQGVSFLRCRYYSNCEWKGGPVFGHCEEEGDTTTTTITKTNFQVTTTTPIAQTTTTVLKCSSLGEKCFFDSQCCSGECKVERFCKNLSIHGICLSYTISKVCV